MNLKGKKVSIFGMGRSGISALKLLNREGALVTAINQGKPDKWIDYPQIKEIIGSDNCVEESCASQVFSQSDLIILSPGIPCQHPILLEAIREGVPVWSEIELGYRFCHTPIIAVTGTNGKTTTVSMIGEMLTHSGYSVFVGGNIGIPFCDCFLEKRPLDYIVLELSSFQLESIVNFRPNIALILNIFPNHGERYKNIESYGKAKFNISKNMTSEDHIIIPQEYHLLNEWGKQQKAEVHALVSTDYQTIKSKLSCKYDLGNFKLQGGHNLANLNFAITSMEILNIQGEGVQFTIDNFSGIPHRLQYVDCQAPFIPLNDAKSTNWDATLTAIKSIDKQDKKLFLILGGKKRGKNDSLTPYIKTIKEKVDTILLIGETTDFLADELDNTLPFHKCYSLENVLSLVKKMQFEGLLLLSPAFPSYDQFKNFEKRGEKFIELLCNWQGT